MKKSTPKMSVVVLFTTAALSVTSHGRPPAVESGLAGAGTENAVRKVMLVGQSAELGLNRDGFEAYRSLKLRGDAFFSKGEHETHDLYRSVYRAITESVISERIKMGEAQGFLDRLLALGEGHVEDPTATNPGLEKLLVDVEVAIVDRVEAEKLTPEVNRLEWLMEEVIRFTRDGGIKKSLAPRLERELESLLSEEESAKGGTNFRESERRDLMAATLEAWWVFVGAGRE